MLKSSLSFLSFSALCTPPQDILPKDSHFFLHFFQLRFIMKMR